MKISESDVKAIFKQGKEESPLEACGYLAGKNGSVIKIVPMRNIDKSEEHFSFDPAEQFKVMRESRNEGLDILGVYHTHPNSPARPSVEDIKLAYDSSVVYVIASLLPGMEEIKAYKITKGEVNEELLMVEKNA